MHTHPIISTLYTQNCVKPYSTTVAFSWTTLFTRPRKSKTSHGSSLPVLHTLLVHYLYKYDRYIQYLLWECTYILVGVYKGIEENVRQSIRDWICSVWPSLQSKQTGNLLSGSGAISPNYKQLKIICCHLTNMSVARKRSGCPYTAQSDVLCYLECVPQGVKKQLLGAAGMLSSLILVHFQDWVELCQVLTRKKIIFVKPTNEGRMSTIGKASSELKSPGVCCMETFSM